MSDVKRILMTGNTGYLGSIMAPWMKKAGYDVVGLDTNYFRNCILGHDDSEIKTIVKDLRDLVPEDLKGFDAIIHLGALSNDPIGNLNSEWTRQINGDGTIRLAELARDAGVRRFLFSSSCIMYGMSEMAVATEDSPLDPQTEYARSKVDAEMALQEMADDNFSPTYCRNGTVYGYSPRMRFDTVLNNFMGMAIATGRVQVFSDGTPWRPVVHVQDVAGSFQAVLEAPLADIHNEAFNMGAEKLNHQILELAQIVVETVPGCELSLVPKADADHRTYKADFTKFSRTFPNYDFKWEAREGARDLYESLKRLGLTDGDFGDKQFTRLKWLRHLLDSHLVDDNLRWTKKSEGLVQ